MAFLKKLFGKHEEEPREEEQAETAAEEASQVPAPETGATLNSVADSIDSCKAALLNCGLSEEETEKYSAALTAMQQAVRGLHPNLDVSDLYEYLEQVFTNALTLIFSGGTPLDRDRAVKTVNESIKAIPSTVESQVRIATLQLVILIQTALILSSRRTINDLNLEKAEYEEAEKELLKASGARDLAGLTESERITFDQYEQQIREIGEQVRGAERLIASYNQEIVNLKGIIRSIQLNPGASSMINMQKQLQELRSKMPGIAEFAALVEQATRNAEQIRAEAKAAIRELNRKLENTAFIADEETEERISQMMAEIHGETEAAEEQKEEQPAETIGNEEAQQDQILTD